VFAEKMKRSLGGLRPPWDGGQLTLSVAIAEAVSRHDYDNEDIVTDLINRVEAGLEEARKRGGNEIIALELART
jgi:GGDEF domain-containing protein